MSEPILKVFSDFLDRADARFKSMREEIRTELLLVIRSEMPAAIPGPQGERGERGMDGRDGKDGAPGMDGKDGKPGERGEKGEPGLNGKDGSDGTPGTDGKDGAPGRDGKDGERGLDGKDGAPGVNGKDGADGLPGKDGARGQQGERGMPGEPGARGEKGLDGKDGTPGRDGRDGVKGDPGRDGKDGISMLEVEAAANRIALKMLSEIRLVGRSLTIGENTVTLPIPVYKGVWRQDAAYEGGDMATWDGSLWHANAATSSKPGEGSDDWTLVAKRGRNAASPVRVE